MYDLCVHVDKASKYEEEVDGRVERSKMLALRRHVQKRRYVMLTYMIHAMSSRASSKIFNCLHMSHITDGWKEIGKLQATKILRLPIMENSSL